MANSFGTNFILINDVQQRLDPAIFRGGPWDHLATVKRGFKEYCAIRHVPTGKSYIEEADPTEPGLFKSIKDDKEWADLYRFLEMHGIFTLDTDKKFAR